MELHDGSAYQIQAEMVYNGKGQRLALTAYQSGQSLTSRYLLDGDTLLSATAKGQTTDYLSGIGEYQTAWSYYLSDGTNTVRQMTDAQGVVTLTRSFTQGSSLGYLGGMLDAVTGLIYVGNGLTMTRPLDGSCPLA